MRVLSLKNKHKDHLTLIRLVTIKKKRKEKEKASVGKDVEKLEPRALLMRMSPWETICQFLKKLKGELSMIQ